MRPFRLLLSLTCCVVAVTLLLYLSIADPADTSIGDTENTKRSGFSALFSFHGPLFPPSAIISLTDDNSTFFLARPAAFGPSLPGRGLSGQLWIGSGFGNDAYGHGYPQATAEGELGCSDVPGWDDQYGLSNTRKSKSKSKGGGSITTSRRKSFSSRAPKLEVQRWEEYRTEAEAQLIKETKDIAGKVVLLSRGGCGFMDKVKWAQRRGGIAVIVGDNVRSGPIITMYARGDTKNVTIPALFTSRTTAHLLSTLVPSGGTLAFPGYSGSRQSSTSSFPGDPRGRSSQTGSASNDLIHKLASAERSGLEQLSNLFGFGKRSMPGDRAERSAYTSTTEVYSDTGALSVRRIRKTKYADFSAFASTTRKQHTETPHSGLWVTLTPTNMSSNPFLDTLLVLVVSPLVTLTVVYALLLLRSRMQRRRWRAPKSVVERLPVRTYHTIPATSPSVATPAASSPTTPLLQTSHRTTSGHSTGSAASEAANASTNLPSEHEKQQHGLAEWRRRYGGRQRECVVCLEEYEDGISRVMSLPCGHEFHAECITPWLTTRRRTCPICKGDVVRSLARTQRGESPSGRNRQRHRQTHHLDHHAHDDSSSDADYSDDDNEEDVQNEAAITRNDSPSAARPIPVNRQASDVYEEDLEGGPASAPGDRPRSRSNIWRRVGSLNIPGLSSLLRSDRREEELDRSR